MGINMPNIPNVGASAIVRQAEKDNTQMKNYAAKQREAEEKRQRAQRQNPTTSGKK